MLSYILNFMKLSLWRCCHRTKHLSEEVLIKRKNGGGHLTLFSHICFNLQKEPTRNRFFFLYDIFTFLLPDRLVRFGSLLFSPVVGSIHQSYYEFRLRSEGFVMSEKIGHERGVIHTNNLINIL